jgi:hypothetical protein
LKSFINDKESLEKLKKKLVRYGMEEILRRFINNKEIAEDN